MSFSPFPKHTSFTPIPDPILGPILASINDVAELKCILRAIWHIHRKKGPIGYVALLTLTRDTVLHPEFSESVIETAMTTATQRGIFTQFLATHGTQETTLYALNFPGSLNLMASTIKAGRVAIDIDLENYGSPVSGKSRSSIYSLYEENVGILTPLIAEQLQDAEKVYPPDWIKDAFTLAVSHNVHNWRYIESILNRWINEGRKNGESGRHTKAGDRERYYKDYLQRRTSPPRG